MGIYACPVCGNPNGWWSGNMRNVHDCPGPPRRQWPQRPEYPPQLDWSEVDGNDALGVTACSVPAIPQRETTPETPEFMPARGMGVAPAPRMLTFDEIDAVYEADRGNNNCFQTQARDLIRKFCEVNGIAGVVGRTK